MIRHEDIKELEQGWGLREDVIEKDYVLGWVLWGIGADEELRDTWIFKGGTCLKKCFLETYRFSEDLDFTVLPGGPVAPDDVRPLINRVMERVADESGIDFSVKAPFYRARQSQSTEGRIYFRGPRGARNVAAIKLDINGKEQVARPPVLRRIYHPYKDELPAPGDIRAYAFEELFAEKIRAMGERGRPRDLYDIINLWRRPDLRTESKLIRTVLEEKCVSKGVPVPDYAYLEISPHRLELESEWKNMLAHQLPSLPPLEPFWAELRDLFDWLAGATAPALPLPVEAMANEDALWTPPATVWDWSHDTDVPFEAIRFAAANHLCVELGYGGGKRIIEPYSLRRTRDGNLILHALRAESREPRAYRVDRIESVAVTNQPFSPVYAVEFSSTGPLFAPDIVRTRNATRTAPGRGSSPLSRASSGPTYIVECSWCGKRFRRKKYSTQLKAHKTKDGWTCSGRQGYVVETR